MKSITLILTFLLLWGCDDIFEQDIEDASIEVIAPKHNTHAPAGEVTFLWRPLKGARSYRLTIVAPGFAAASRSVTDTTLRVDSLHSADRFTLTLDAGAYEWCLQGANGAYRTKETVYTLTVDPVPAPEPDPETSTDPDDPADQDNRSNPVVNSPFPGENQIPRP